MHWGFPAIIPLQHNQMHASTSFSLCAQSLSLSLSFSLSLSLSLMACFNMVPDLCACYKDYFSYFFLIFERMWESGSGPTVICTFSNLQLHLSFILLSNRVASKEEFKCRIYSVWYLHTGEIHQKCCNPPPPPSFPFHYHHTHFKESGVPHTRGILSLLLSPEKQIFEEVQHHLATAAVELQPETCLTVGYKQRLRERNVLK